VILVGRILNGDPNWSDSWHDIAGYAQLVATNRLNGRGARSIEGRDSARLASMPLARLRFRSRLGVRRLAAAPANETFQ
jgi:hypothetical protein